MDELIKKITPYQIFNYLLPGVIFVVILKNITYYDLTQDDILVAFFLYYFIGLIISRIGSLIIEPFLKKIKIIKFARYEDFINASKNDSKIEILSEQNNTYRTITSLFILLILFKVYESVSYQIGFFKNNYALVLTTLLLILVIFSYTKQTVYIKRRIDNQKYEKNSNV